MLFWKKKKSRKNTYKNNAFPRYADKMSGEFDTKKFNCGIYGKNTAVPVAAGETTILSENMRLSIHDEKTHLNNNMFIIADDSYADKLMMANILQCNSSFAVADVGGKILAEVRTKLVDAGYDIQVLDINHPETSAKYNPLRFVKDKEDAEMLARCIAGDDFGALSDVILQVLSGNAEEEQTMANVAKLIAGSKPGLCGIDIFLRPEITNLTPQNDMILDTAGERLTGIFIVCPEEKSDADVLANIMMMQLHRVLVKAAKEKYNGERLPYLTRLYFNHIERYGGNPFFLYMDRGDCFLNVRRYNIAYTFACRGLSFVKKIYGEDAGCIFANADAVIYCSSDDEVTSGYIYRKVGIRIRCVRHHSGGSIDPVPQRRVITYKELLALPEDECYIMLRGYDDILDKKYTK
ncbi:type IV secretory system conjugative DNA transfer family protein [Ruminococcus sp. AF14-5]|nr:type IV secretory system conjugative DNA transfer family protein [Ruminococcus sp. AF14-5]